MNRSAVRLILHVLNGNHSGILCIFLKSNFRKPLFEYFPPLFCTHDTIEASLLFWPVREYFCENHLLKHFRYESPCSVTPVNSRRTIQKSISLRKVERVRVTIEIDSANGLADVEKAIATLFR